MKFTKLASARVDGEDTCSARIALFKKKVLGVSDTTKKINYSYRV